MGRLKRDHSGWGTTGKWLKYQEPTYPEKKYSGKSKKDTNKWCRGKVGVPHEWHSYQDKIICWLEERYFPSYTKIVCINCKKKKVSRTKNAIKYPFHVWIESEYSRTQIQVKVNGRAIPMGYPPENSYWCEICLQYHY